MGQATRVPSAAPRARQTTLFDRIEELASRATSADPRKPAMAVFGIVLALMGVGLLIQASHAATTCLPGDRTTFEAVLQSEIGMRLLAILVLLGAQRLGPQGLRRFLPALVVLSILSLLFVLIPALGGRINGARRWLTLPGGFSFQPSELARIVMVLWIADRCMRLGPRVREIRQGVLPMLAMTLGVFGLIAVEPDFGGGLLFLCCALCTMWVGGARPTHVFGSLFTVSATALLIAVSSLAYVRGRIASWFDPSTNDQVSGTVRAMAGGDLYGLGYTHGPFRNAGVPYMESDYAFALVGEELGFLGMAFVLGGLLAYAWFSLRLVLSIRNRYLALAAFGLLISVALQAMLHVQVVTGLAPPKGMTLPFISSGGTSLVVSSLAVGLALGSARGSTQRPAADLP